MTQPSTTPDSQSAAADQTAPAQPKRPRSKTSRLLDLTRTKKIMIVDDEPINIKVSKKYLEAAGYDKFITETDATSALSVIAHEVPDVILLDIVMPEVDGLQLLAAIRRSAKFGNLPVIILTASTDRETKTKALQYGATDFLSKPVDPSELVLRVRNVLAVKVQRDRLARHAEELEKEVTRRTEELRTSREEIVQCLARAAENRDTVTGNHIIRVGRYAALIAEGMGLKPERCELINYAAQLHDVGKIGVPDEILLKPGKLTEAEFEIIKEHCFIGQKILQQMSEDEYEMLKQSSEVAEWIIQSRSSELIQLAATIAISHHERWDGKGYPYGLEANNIPLEGRITAVADVFDALTSSRQYKPSFEFDESIAQIVDRKGLHFDPNVVDSFISMLPHIIETAQALQD